MRLAGFLLVTRSNANSKPQAQAQPPTSLAGGLASISSSHQIAKATTSMHALRSGPRLEAMLLRTLALQPPCGIHTAWKLLKINSGLAFISATRCSA